jgi:hypothetical protein
VGKFQPCGVQEHRINLNAVAEQTVLTNLSVCRIPYHGMSDMPHVTPYLMPSSTLRFDCNHRIAGRLVRSDRVRQLNQPDPPIRRTGFQLPPIGRVFQGMVDDSVLQHPTANDGKVNFPHGAFGESLSETTGGLRVESEQKYTGGFAVNPVDRVDPPVQLVPEPIHRGDPVRGDTGSMDQQPRRLIDRCEKSVTIQNRQQGAPSSFHVR